ncbi:MAG: hypothetical protein QF724_03135 [Planctomycetota bacterium]|nr:hypothetical protein [Planctomycetota bacterium]MDP6367980.1 hypothetical protein [Planctomycetota bacterium]MDP6519471.1 hypothetical protein [Planctomycetota bacterium]MDP6837905.1 hypothetical protein [Planctomycetota bacterium]
MKAPAIRRLQVNLRRLSWAISLGAICYLAWRFESLTLPANGCSPLARFQVGQTLLTDSHPKIMAVGDALLFRAAGEIHLARVAALRGSDGLDSRTGGSALQTVDGDLGLWVLADNPRCPGRDSSSLGWIKGDDVCARVLFVWPW